MVIIKQNNSTLILAVNNEIIQCDTENSTTQIETLPKVNLPSNLTKGQEEILKNEDRKIISFCISKDREFYAVSTNNKQLVVYDKRYKIIRNIVLNRASSKLCFSPQNDLIVADKTGEAYLYKINDEKDEGTWLLGHNSMLLDICVTNCGKYIITSDRDEKIRVSCFPNAYNIVTYCLGHEEFVTNVFINGKTLLSASGDGTLRTWNFIEGKQLAIARTNSYIENVEACKKFCEAMDSENVDIKVLPITNLKVYSISETEANIAVSVLNISAIQLYKLLECELKFVTNVELSSPLISFSLGKYLYILINDSFKFYDTEQKTFQNVEYLNNLFEKYKDLLSKPYCSTEISILYKRKYDNVQEYLERKKLRLENK